MTETAPAPLALLPNRSIGLGPYVQTDGWLHTFCLEGDSAKIDAWLKRQFHDPSGGAVAYEAITSKLFLSFARFGQVRADSPLDRDHGVVPENDAALWALARRTEPFALEIFWVPLFVFVDEGSAMATGREVYGFPKQMAAFDVPTTKPPSAGPFRISATVLDPYARDTAARRAPIFEVESLSAAASATSADLTPPAGLGETVAKLLAEASERVDASWIGGALKNLSPLFDLPVTMAFLKQFPDTADPTKACFQSIVEADARTLKVRGGGWTADRYRVRVNSYDSHPFHEALGVAEGWRDVGRAIYADFDFVMELGKDVWRR
jgi:hypothetical protein